MKIQIVEPYFTGSHRVWAEGYLRHSQHEVEILSLEGRYWKWRMHGGAVSLARTFLSSKEDPDLLLTTDMLDLTTFLALTRERTSRCPVAVYFHENQISYPWSPIDRDVLYSRDKHYGFINYATALAADALLFNSCYHRDVFLEEIPRLLKHFPDHRGLDTVKELKSKSHVLHVGVDFSRLDSTAPPDSPGSVRSGTPRLLWNHRWEYDKNPEDFFTAIGELKERGVDFELVVLGESFGRQPEAFERAQTLVGDRIIQFGDVESFERYAEWLHESDILPVTSVQDFFGISIVEAVYCGCYPLLPKRLTFPELFPGEENAENFYEDLPDLVNRLLDTMERIEEIRKKDLRSCVERFSWSRMAPQYDTFFEELVKAKKRRLA